MERHAILRRMARIFYVLPGVRTAIRRLVRLAIQEIPQSLSRTNRERLFNFFAKDVSPSNVVFCTTVIPVMAAARKEIGLALSLQDDLSRWWYFWAYSGYERGTTRVLCELLSSKSQIFDVGANVGYYSLLAAAILEGRGVVHAFEPAPEPYQCLKHNVEQNGFKCLRLNNSAMSDKDGEELLFPPFDFTWSNASLVRGFWEQGRPFQVKATRFDTYCAANGITTVDLVRMDVEGAELKALQGMGVLLDSWSPDIVCEVLKPFDAAMNEFFVDRAYRKFLITDEGLQEVDEIKAHARHRDFYLSRAPASRLLHH